MNLRQRRNWLLEMWLIASGQTPNEYPLHAIKEKARFKKSQRFWLLTALLVALLAMSLVVALDVL